MAKFKLKFKLTGLEVEMEGDRQDVPQMTASLANQLGGLLAPATSIMLDDSAQKKARVVEAELAPEIDVKKRKSHSRRTSSGKVASADVGEAIDFAHKAEKWGNPDQTWTAKEKAVWLLFIVGEQTNQKELSAGVIAATFNKHFRQAGAIRPSNVSRDLGKMKSKPKPPQIGENTSVSPATWYLTHEGEKEAGKLVNHALGEPST